MKLFLILFSTILLSCNNHSTLNIEYPTGGYDFPKTIINQNFYCYPLIDKVSRRDSFQLAYHDAYYFRLFEEPNLSLKPSQKAIFRLTYQYGGYAYIINLTEDELTVKTGNWPWWSELDLDKLTENERMHYLILKREYPLDETRTPTPPPPPRPPPPPDKVEEENRSRKIYDSIKMNTPELLNRQYYDYLLKKAAVKNTFRYSIRKIKIAKEDFIKFVNLLNQSGYWEVRYYPKCNEEISYLYGSYEFSLEANTGRKYNYVGYPGPCDSLSNNYYEAFRELLILANIKKRR